MSTLFDRTWFVSGTPVPWGRPRVDTRRGRIHWYERESVTRWRSHVRLLSRSQRPSTPLDGPIETSLVFLLPRTKRMKPGGRQLYYVQRKNDIDNLEKAVLDALDDDGWFGDDGQVCYGPALKLYAGSEEKPGVFIRVRQIDEGMPIDELVKRMLGTV